MQVFKQPFKRVIAPLVDEELDSPEGCFGVFMPYLGWRGYAENDHHFAESAIVLQNDLLKLFEYVAPSSSNFETYSIRIHQLLVRVCIEVEANFKAILSENGYIKEKFLNTHDYRKVGNLSALQHYQVKIHGWNEPSMIFEPFSSWEENLTPKWWLGYNAVKHDRHKEFQHANLENLVNACCALFVLLSSQFHLKGFAPPSSGITIIDGEAPPFCPTVGGRFLIKFPEISKYLVRYSIAASEESTFSEVPWDKF